MEIPDGCPAFCGREDCSPAKGHEIAAGAPAAEARAWQFVAAIAMLAVLEWWRVGIEAAGVCLLTAVLGFLLGGATARRWR